MLIFFKGLYIHRYIYIYIFELQVYPGRDITNIVESSHYQKIGGWCRQGTASAAKCKGAQRWIKPFRCLGMCDTNIYLYLLVVLYGIQVLLVILYIN